MEKLTEKQIVILNFIKNFKDENDFSPSVREIGQGVGCASPATIHRHLVILRNLNKIKFITNVSRSISLVNQESK